MVRRGERSHVPTASLRTARKTATFLGLLLIPMLPIILGAFRGSTYEN